LEKQKKERQILLGWKEKCKIVEEFLRREENPECYDFKLENPYLMNCSQDSLVRELHFKKNNKGFDPDCCELNMILQCILLHHNGLNILGYKGKLIGVDCGCGYDGYLGCLCLETMDEFYV